MTQDALLDTGSETGTTKPRQWVGPHVAQWLADRTRHLTADRCRGCRADILRGLNDDWCAWTIEVDPTPLSPLGEALARLAGRSTVACESWGGAGPKLSRRGHHQITGRPAGSGRFDVLATHLCGAPALPSAPSTFTKPNPSSDVDDVCPF